MWAERLHSTELPSLHDLDFEAILLTHAKLYTLADYMLLTTLKVQAFQRLQSLLGFISAPSIYASPPDVAILNLPLINTPLIGNLITLVRYIYRNTPQLKSENEPLRDLISTFIAEHYEQFGDDQREVASLMVEGGEFQEDLHSKMRRPLKLLT